MKTPLLVVVGGPTGIGKTAMAIELAQRFNTEIISADSRQVYKELSIGTAVPSKNELSAVKHHFIHTKSVEDRFNASIYEFEALSILENLFLKYNIVVMVGGSGLYIDAVCDGIDDLPTIPANVRRKYDDFYKSQGLKKLQERVRAVDPIYFKKVDINNHKRLLKALEVFDVTNQPYSSFLKNKPKNRPFQIFRINLDMNREELYSRINNRVDTMLEMGLEEEVFSMQSKSHLTPLKTVGYKEFFNYFDGKIDRIEAIEQIKNHTRAYARKQLTWFRKYQDSHWFEPSQLTKIRTVITNIL